MRLGWPLLGSDHVTPIGSCELSPFSQEAMTPGHLNVVFGHGLEPLGAQSTAVGEACYPLPSICGHIIQRTL